jgi:regulator of protease activity HflC (stomatin/prohibitin superfamily)
MADDDPRDQIPYFASLRAPHIVGLVLGAGVLVALAWSSFYVTDAGEHVVVFNQVTGSLREATAGAHLKLPIVDKISRYETRTQTDTYKAEAASNDLQVIDAQIAVSFHPDDGSITWLHQNVGTEYQARIIGPAVQESVKAATAQFNATALIEQRPLVKQVITEALAERLAKYKIVLDVVSITDFDFSKEFNSAIEAKVVAQQDAEQAKNKLQQITYEAQQRVIQAAADLEAANKTAQIKVVQAEADAAASRLLENSLTSEYLQLLRIRAWNGVLPTTYVPGSAGNSTSVLVGLP